MSTPTRGFGELFCPRCHETTPIALDLDDLNACVCRACDADFTLEDVEEFQKQIAQWDVVIAWVKTAPTKAS